MESKIVNNHLLRVYVKNGAKKEIITLLAWGDPIQVGAQSGDEYPVRVTLRKEMEDGSFVAEDVDAFVSMKAQFLDPSENDIVRLTFVDVQQGDAAVLETHKGTIVIVDGGENQMFARYLATRFPNTTAGERLPVRAIVVTHGDADHFQGLVKIQESEVHPTKYKQIFIQPELVLHNGLVKRTNADDPDTAFGATDTMNGQKYVVDLADNLLENAPPNMNAKFQSWTQALRHWSTTGNLDVRRVSNKINTNEFKFLLDEGIGVEVLSPLEEQVEGKPGLPMLRETQVKWPKPGEEFTGPETTNTYSASQTINGNSIVLLLTYGKIRILLTGDLNSQAENELLRRAPTLSAHILKVPHHGSADYSPSFLKAVNPVLSVISSGDENERVEYVHPRATLVASLGQYSRKDQALVLVTELVAFFKTMGYAKVFDKNEVPCGAPFFSFKRAAYGIVHIAFNKDKVLVFTHTGKRDLKEAYAFSVSRGDEVRFEEVKPI